MNGWIFAGFIVLVVLTILTFQLELLPVEIIGYFVLAGIFGLGLKG